MRIIELIIFVSLFWVVEYFNRQLGYQLNYYGILPRTESGLVGITVWPFLHTNTNHLLANSLPLAVLAWFVLLHGFRVFFNVTIGITFFAGLLIWLMARPAIHLGASGLIFGYFGFLVAVAWYKRDIKSSLIALATLMFYGGLVWRVSPQLAQVSWEAHFSGLVIGAFIASFYKAR